MQLYMDQRNQRLMDVLLKKIEKTCPGAVDIVGICGSFCTGDFHERSDLDLMILINDEKAYEIAECFVIGNIGFDFYCTTWESLENDAKCGTPHLAKLMDTKIVYSKSQEVNERYYALREHARSILSAPFSVQDLSRAKDEYRNAELKFSELMRTPDDLFGCRCHAVELMYYVENTVCILNKTYFKYGVKRIFEEFARMQHVPENFEELINSLVKAETTEDIKERATMLMCAVDAEIEKAESSLLTVKEKPNKSNIGGTLEEMISNFRGKVWKAIESGDAHASLSALTGLQSFFDDLAAGLDMPRYDALSGFDPNDLEKTAEAYEKAIDAYRSEYVKVGMELNAFDSIDAFEKHYLQ